MQLLDSLDRAPCFSFSFLHPSGVSESIWVLGDKGFETSLGVVVSVSVILGPEEKAVVIWNVLWVWTGSPDSAHGVVIPHYTKSLYVFARIYNTRYYLTGIYRFCICLSKRTLL